MDPYACWLMSLTGVESAWRGDLHHLLGALRMEEPDADDAALVRSLYEMPEGTLLQLVHAALEDARRCGPLLDYLVAGRRREPAAILEDLIQQDIHCAMYYETAFPDALRHIPDAPLGLYWRGRLPAAERPALAIIGARMSSPYGRVQARDFAIELARNGIQIVSGMARGIDGIAGKAALEVSDDSYAVLGCGVDICYPTPNKELYDMLIARGGVISEFPPGTPATKRNFPQRNRIISGLSDAVLVIEAREKSGTLITVDVACEQGRDIYALPGRVSDSTSHGCNELIRQGAMIATSPDDLLTYYYSDTAVRIRMERQTMEEAPSEEALRRKERRKAEQGARREREERRRQERLDAVGEVGRTLYALLDEATPVSLDDLVGPARREMDRQVSFSEIMRAMTSLVMGGLAKELRVGCYIRLP